MTLEREVPLSESILWRLTRAYYERAGPRAWSEAVVPHYVTSNAFVADALARIARAFLEDEGADRATVVEIGSGHGRFGFHFLRAFARSRDVRAPRIRYVMTDLARANVEHLRARPALRPFVESKDLDFAVFDLAADASLDLIESGERLGPGALEEPIVVVANYLLCVVPQDAYRIRDGRLSEARVTTTAPDDAGDPEDPALLASLLVEWTDHPLRAQEPGLADVLREYEAGPDASVTFPAIGALGLRRLRALTRGASLVLAVDRADAHAQSFAGRAPPTPAIHGGVSLRANLHALGRLQEREGGLFLRAPAPAPFVETVALASGGRPRAATQRAFREAAVEFGPDAFYGLKRGFDATAASQPAESLLAFLALSRHDPNVFLLAAGPLAAHVAGSPGLVRAAIAAAVEEAAKAQFPVGDVKDVPFALGSVLYALGRHEEALVHLDASVAEHGPHRATLFNMALALVALRRPAEALARLEAAVALDPTFERAARMRDGLRKAVRAEATAGPQG